MGPETLPAGPFGAYVKDRRFEILRLPPGRYRLMFLPTVGDRPAGPEAEDGVQMPPFAPANIGKKMMINWVRGFLDVFVLEGFALSVAELQVKGDWALERGTYTINFTHRPSGNVIPDLGKYITIWQRLPDGAWGMARDIWNSDNRQAGNSRGN